MKLPFSDLPAFRRDPLALFEERAFGTPPGFLPLNLALKPLLLVTEPESARKIMRWDTAEIDKSTFVQRLRPLIGDSLLVNLGEEHARSKAAIHRSLQKNALAVNLEPMVAILTQFAARLAKDPTFVTTDETPLLSLRLGCAAFFGKNVLSDAEQIALVGAVQTVEREIAAEMFSPFANMPWKAKAKRSRIEDAKAIVRHVLDRVRASESRGALLSAMEEAGLNEDEIVSEFLGLFIAGHHSTGATFGWMIYHLAKDPQIGEALMLEADEVLGEIERGNMDALRKAELSNAFAQEVMRLYPGGWWTSRECKADVEIDGRSFQKGQTFVISPWVFHRDARNWIDPLDLRLDRTHSGPAYMPFGVGPRACIGMSVAVIELQLLALMLASAFQFELKATPRGIKPEPSVALLAPPFVMQAHARREVEFRDAVA